MKNKFPKIFENSGLKLISFILSLLLWVLITNFNDPIYYMQISNVPVRLLHTNLITDQGEVYSVLDGTDVVPSVTVAARRSVIESLVDSNIVATADIENMTSLYTVEIKYYSTKFNSEIQYIEGSTENVRLSVEPKLTTLLTLSTTTVGEPDSNFMLDKVEPEQNQVRVSGPKSVVSSIKSAVATVDVTGTAGNISTYSDIRLLDADGNAVDASSLTMNISSVKVNVSVIPVKNVPITASLTGATNNGVVISGQVTTDPATVKLAGKSTALSQIDSIVIPYEQLGITNANGVFETDVDVRWLLPDGVSFADKSFDGMVHVLVSIEPAASVVVTASPSDIAVTGVPEGYTAEIISVFDGDTLINAADEFPQFEIRLTGLVTELSNIRSGELPLEADISGIDPEDGETHTFTTKALAALPQGVVQSNEITVGIELTKDTKNMNEGE